MPKYLFPFIAGNLVGLKPHKQQGLKFENILFHTSLKFENLLIYHILHYKCKIICGYTWMMGQLFLYHLFTYLGFKKTYCFHFMCVNVMSCMNICMPCACLVSMKARTGS